MLFAALQRGVPESFESRAMRQRQDANAGHRGQDAAAGTPPTAGVRPEYEQGGGREAGRGSDYFLRRSAVLSEGPGEGLRGG